MAVASNLPRNVGRYEIQRLLGQGAMGRVLLARDPVVDREVAIKLLRDDLRIGPEVRDGLFKRMRQEARASARVTHPNIVTLHDMIDDDELGVCLVFEFVRGQTLKDRIAQGPVPALEASKIARELGSALALAHAEGVLHRDIKPENIMLAEHGAKVTDFGIARVPDSTLTRAGGLMGTPAYSAPECIRGGSFSPASDQFSLAATMYEAVSGRRAFPGDDAVTVAARIGTETPPCFAEELGLPVAIDEVLLRALSREASERYANCREFGEALAAALESEGVERTVAEMFPGAVRVEERAQRSWLSVALGGAAVGALGALVVTSVWRGMPPTALDLAASRGSAGLKAGDADAAWSVPTQKRRPAREPRATGTIDVERDAEAAEGAVRVGGVEAGSGLDAGVVTDSSADAAGDAGQ